jgi:hypothetical protein
MKAIAIDDYSAPPTLHELPVPEPGEGEVTPCGSQTG